MKDLHRLSRVCGCIWATLMIASSLLIPREGTWTIDDGVKRIAAQTGNGMWAERTWDGAIRSRLDDPSEYPALLPPFAERKTGRYEFGFSPWARVLHTYAFDGSSILARIAPALISILVWIVFETAGVSFAFLLLPLTFYGLIPWEHALSWFLAWPAIWLILRHDKKPSLRFAAGLLLAAAIMLRHETLIAGAALIGYEIFRIIRRKANIASVGWFAGGILAGAAALILWQGATSDQSPLIQWQMNRAAGWQNFGDWLGGRFTALFELLLRTDRTPLLSGIILVLTLSGVYSFWKAEKNSAKMLRTYGLLALSAATVIPIFRMWDSPLPPVTLMKANSLFVCLPWLLLLLLPPYRSRPALRLGILSVVAAIASAPVWEGVHWGPRILLFAVPFFIMDLMTSERMRGKLFTILIALTLIQTVNSGVLCHARLKESSDHVQLVEAKLGTPVICPTTSQCADLAALWKNHEFFTAASPRELKQLLIDLRFAGVDTAWLHLGARDPLYIQTFPEAKPVWPYRMSVIQAGNVYRTMWRVYELVMNRGDTLWADVLEKEAGSLMLENRREEALKLQLEAVALTPRSAERHHNLALIFIQLGEHDAARDEAERAHELNPALPEPIRLLEWLPTRIPGAP